MWRILKRGHDTARSRCKSSDANDAWRILTRGHGLTRLRCKSNDENNLWPHLDERPRFDASALQIE